MFHINIKNINVIMTSQQRWYSSLSYFNSKINHLFVQLWNSFLKVAFP